MKKKFKDTAVGKLLGGLAKIVAKNTPVIGDLMDNVTSLDGGEGNLDYRKLASQIIRLVLFGIAVYLFFTGKLSFDELQNF